MVMILRSLTSRAPLDRTREVLSERRRLALRPLPNAQRCHSGLSPPLSPYNVIQLAMLATQIAASLLGHREQLGRLADLVRQHRGLFAIGQSRQEQRLELFDAPANPIPFIDLGQ
jgi:hypothetical protein